MFSGNSGIPVTMNVEPSGSGNNGGWGGGFGDGWWAIIIFAMIFGWGNGGWGGFGNGSGNGAQGALTRTDLCSEFNFNNLDSAVRSLQSGLCDSTFALNNTINSGFAGVDNAICNLGYNVQQGINGINTSVMQGNFALQQAINADTVANMQNTNALSTQLANCCCENRAAAKDTQYAIATQTNALQNSMCLNTRDIIDNQNATSRQILDFLVNDKMATLQTENQNLKLAASQAQQNNYLISQLRPCPQPAYLTCNPFTGQYGGYGYGNNGCGCASGGCC